MVLIDINRYPVNTELFEIMTLTILCFCISEQCQNKLKEKSIF